jgi:hypothetical protein
MPLALSHVLPRGIKRVLRISVIRDSDEAIHLQLEGRLVGPWVDELRRWSEEVLAQEKALCLDLQGVWFADREGNRFAEGSSTAASLSAQLLAIHKAADK